jgi:catechol 2,3-dioxygenase-like lactoylglutathione lyase family enzyme
MPVIQHLLEASLYCDDLPRALRFYRDLLGLEPLFVDDRLAALDAGGGTVLLLFRPRESAGGVSFPGGWIPPHDGAGPVHLALAVEAAHIAELEARLTQAGYPVESHVTWGRGGRSIYCRDPDGHSIEFATPGVWAVY